jgi:hypothetical protein
MGKAHIHLLNIKRGYDDNFTIRKANLHHKVYKDIPRWFNDIAESLQLYLDVKIIRIRVLLGNSSQPSLSYSVIGDEKMVTLAIHYLDYLYNTIEKTISDYRNEWKDRRRIGNLREESSKYRRRLIKEVIIHIKELLDSIKTNPVIMGKGVKRQELVETQLVNKYGKEWKSYLLRKSI